MRYLTADDRAKMTLVQTEPRGPSQLIEIPCTVAGLSQLTFPDVANLRNQSDQIVIIKAIRLITAEVLSNAPTLGFVNAPVTELVKMSLNLYCEGWIKGQLIPILTINDTHLPGGTFPYKWNVANFDSWRNVDWNKSTIQFSNGTVSVVAENYAVCVEVEYVKMRKDPNNPDVLIEIVGPN